MSDVCCYSVGSRVIRHSRIWESITFGLGMYTGNVREWGGGHHECMSLPWPSTIGRSTSVMHMLMSTGMVVGRDELAIWKDCKVPVGMVHTEYCEVGEILSEVFCLL